MGRRKVMKVRGEERRKKEGEKTGSGAGSQRKGEILRTLALGDHTLTQTRGRVLSPINR